jgi:hypothetical protein
MSVKEHIQLNFVKMRKWAMIMHVHSSRIGKSEVLVAGRMKVYISWNMIHGGESYPHHLSLCALRGACADPEQKGIMPL